MSADYKALEKQTIADITALLKNPKNRMLLDWAFVGTEHFQNNEQRARFLAGLSADERETLGNLEKDISVAMRPLLQTQKGRENFHSVLLSAADAAIAKDDNMKLRVAGYFADSVERNAQCAPYLEALSEVSAVLDKGTKELADHSGPFLRHLFGESRSVMTRVDGERFIEYLNQRPVLKARLDVLVGDLEKQYHATLDTEPGRRAFRTAIEANIKPFSGNSGPVKAEDENGLVANFIADLVENRHRYHAGTAGERPVRGGQDDPIQPARVPTVQDPCLPQR